MARKQILDREAERASVGTGGRPKSRSLLGAVAAVPAAILPLLPSLTCPLCLAAYGGVLSSLGLGFLVRETVLQPLIVVFLLVTIASIAWATKRHRRPAPLLLAVAGSLAILAGRLVWTAPLAVYGGAAGVVVAAIWNLFLRKSPRTKSTKENTHVLEASDCGCCAPAGSASGESCGC